ncbi:zinc-binding dehydrogenase [Edaphobacter aggregans]|uniref:zinc-binding dehydrogenase n=1 Tax=Edaphobacter aggregans TaxID=570835 RepID=UPI000A51CF37|nr:alcohol dehydrogenase catalytic domain-containing protein [Edaphobacter aggregans]
MRIQTDVLTEAGQSMQVKPGTMKALVFNGDQRISLEDRSIPKAGPSEAVIEITLTTICGTDVHIVKGEYPVKRGLTLGHEAVGRIHELGSGVSGYEVGERVLVGAITPCGQCNYCLGGNLSQCGGTMGGWKLGNTINGVQAQYALIPYAQANLAKIPDELSDEQVILLADIASTGFSASESAQVKLGDSVAIFAEGPIGLCATAGAKLRGAGQIFAVDSNPVRLEQALRMGAHYAINISKQDPIEEILRLTERRGVDVAIEALGRQETFENALRVLRPGGTLSSLGVYSGKLAIPAEPFAAGLGDHKIVTTLCPGGMERMRRLMELVLHHRIDLTPLLTHRFTFDKIVEAYTLFSKQEDGVLKVAIRVC